MVTAAELLASAAGMEGKYSQAFPFFGSEKRGPPVMSFCRISDKPIDKYAQIYEPDIALVADPTVVESGGVAKGLKKGSIVIANHAGDKSDLKFDAGIKVFVVDGSAIALKNLKRPIYNTVMLGALVKITGIVKLESIEKAVRDEFGGAGNPVAEANVAAVRECYELAKKE